MWHTGTLWGLKTEARAADLWSKVRSILSNYRVTMVKGTVTCKDDHRASFSALVGTRFSPTGSVAPSRVLEAEEREDQK